MEKTLKIGDKLHERFAGKWESSAMVTKVTKTIAVAIDDNSGAELRFKMVLGDNGLAKLSPEPLLHTTWFLETPNIVAARYRTGLLIRISESDFSGLSNDQLEQILAIAGN